MEKAKLITTIVIIIYIFILAWNIYDDMCKGKLNKEKIRCSRLCKHVAILREQFIRVLLIGLIEFSLVKSFSNLLTWTLAATIIYVVNEEFPLFEDRKTLIV